MKSNFLEKFIEIKNLQEITLQNIDTIQLYCNVNCVLQDKINYQSFDILYLTQNKMNLFVLSGHGSESFAAFLNEVILQTKNNAAVITAAVITTHHESELRFR